MHFVKFSQFYIIPKFNCDQIGVPMQIVHNKKCYFSGNLGAQCGIVIPQLKVFSRSYRNKKQTFAGKIRQV